MQKCLLQVTSFEAGVSVHQLSRSHSFTLILALKTWVKLSHNITWTYISVTRILWQDRKHPWKKDVFWFALLSGRNHDLYCNPPLGSSQYALASFLRHTCVVNPSCIIGLRVAVISSSRGWLSLTPDWVHVTKHFSLIVCDFCLLCIFFLACTLSYFWSKISGWIISESKTICQSVVGFSVCGNLSYVCPRPSICLKLKEVLNVCLVFIYFLLLFFVTCLSQTFFCPCI